uniref:Uncharacterized protein n=1 Tax=Anguilla anguilla TaxID=7936 RepID=A0A0E9UQ02_ANGAN
MSMMHSCNSINAAILLLAVLFSPIMWLQSRYQECDFVLLKGPLKGF